MLKHEFLFRIEADAGRGCSRGSVVCHDQVRAVGDGALHVMPINGLLGAS